jgi:hypothetical protein
MYPKLYIPSYINVCLLIILPISYKLLFKEKVKIKRNLLILTFVFIVLQFLTIFQNGFSFDFDIYLILAIISALMYTSTMKFETFILCFRQIIFTISAISTLIYLLKYFLPNLLSMLPNVLTQVGDTGTYTLAFSFVVNNSKSYYRNFGIFSEPGQFQIFISIGFIIELFFQKKISWKHIAVLSAALLTAYSTNGFISTAIIIVAFSLNSNKLSKIKIYKSLKKAIVVFFLLIIIIALIGNEFLIDLLDEINSKLIELTQHYSYTDLGSGLERKRAFDVAFQAFLHNPLVGVGYSGMERMIRTLTSTRIILTCAPLNWFARWGIIYGILANFLYLSSFLYKPINNQSKVVLCIGLFSMISAQAVNQDPIIWVLIFYGFGNLKNCRKTNEKEPKSIVIKNQYTRSETLA